MARRAFLHLGTPKSGTTYLQSLWWQQKQELADQGLLLPGRDEHAQFNASVVVRANAELISHLNERQRGAWDRLLSESRDFDGDVLFTQEQLVETAEEPARRAVAQMAEVADEVHLVVTARDLPRIIPSAWQQRIKHGAPTTLAEFCGRVAKDDPTFNFWRHQDLPRILERWAADLPAERVHVVPLPGPGSPRDLLWRRTSELFGLDADRLSASSPSANDSLSPGEIEFLRRVNEHFDAAHRDVATSRHLRELLGPHVGNHASRPASLVLSEQMYAWARERGNAMVDELAAAPWDVVGDLDDLRAAPERPAGVDPDEVADSEVVTISTDVVAGLVEALRDARQLGASTPDAPAGPATAGVESEPRRGLGRWLRR